jgi:hypothetical protein
MNSQKILKLISITIYLLIIIGCSNSDSQVVDDITKFQWKLVSIELEDETIILSERSYAKDLSYILIFTENSTFSLDTSVNAAMGKYSINSNLLSFIDYKELSEAGTNDPEQLKIDELLLQRLMNITEFKSNEDHLILTSMNSKLVFQIHK